MKQAKGFLVFFSEPNRRYLVTILALDTTLSMTYSLVGGFPV
jgi:hypothetical protein